MSEMGAVIRCLAPSAGAPHTRFMRTSYARTSTVDSDNGTENTVMSSSGRTRHLLALPVIIGAVLVAACVTSAAATADQGPQPNLQDAAWSISLSRDIADP